MCPKNRSFVLESRSANSQKEASSDSMLHVLTCSPNTRRIKFGLNPQERCHIFMETMSSKLTLQEWPRIFLSMVLSVSITLMIYLLGLESQHEVLSKQNNWNQQQWWFSTKQTQVNTLELKMNDLYLYSYSSILFNFFICIYWNCFQSSHESLRKRYKVKLMN